MKEKLEGKTLLILGGNLEKEDIKSFARMNGVKLVAVGNNPNADYCTIADEYYNINSTNETAMKAFIRSHGIGGVYMGGNEQVIGCACKYLNEMGFPCYCTPEQWDLIQNKGNFKALCRKAGLPVAKRFLSIEDVSDSDFPVITKPIDGAGSKGFSVCQNREELIKGCEKAHQFSFGGGVLIEKFMPNKSLVVIYSFSAGEMFYSATENKIPVHYEKQGSFVKGIALLESGYAKEFRSLYEDRLKAMFSSIGIQEGTIWIEVFRDGGEYYFNEAGFRYSGSSTPYPVDYCSGINQVFSDLTFSLTGKSCLFGNPSLIPEKIERGKHYCMLPIHMKAGTIAAIEGIQEIENLNECVKVVLKKKVGNQVEDSGSFDQVFCIVHFVFSKEEELRGTMKKIFETIKVYDKNGNNLVHNMLDFESFDFFL